MRTTIVRVAAFTALSAFALTGCGTTTSEEPVAAPTVEADVEEQLEPSDDGGEDPVAAPQLDGNADEPPANEITGPGVYQADMYGGAVATVAVPGAAPEDLEQLREDAGADPVGYLIVEIDNTQGSDEAFLWEARVVDSEGQTHRYEDVIEGTDDWADSNDSLMDRQLEMWDKYPYSVDPTAKSTVPLIGPEVPEDIVSVFVEDARAERVGDL